MKHIELDEFVVDDTVRASPARGGLYDAWGKRALDLALCLFILPSVAPVVLLLALATALRDGGNPFFGHVRIGRGGRPFRCWKIRTMVPDSAELLVRHLARHPEAAAEWRARRKLADDPRVTPLGDFLRKTSLDELPQLWNVLRGEMSFVGPRPVPEDELEFYGTARSAYVRMRPGITGLWQISDRNALGYGERVEMDVEYLRRRSLPLDLSIILRTTLVVIQPTGR